MTAPTRLFDRYELLFGETPHLLHEFFELQVLRRPNHPALECNGETLTYRELDAKANRIAHMLHARGICPGALVGLFFDKSSLVFAALLGILKAGAGYVPIDPNFMDMVGSTVTNQPVPIEMDQRKRNYLHPVAGSAAAKVGAGLFAKPSA